MKPLNTLFSVEYGNKLDLNKMRRLARSKGGVNFVNRSSQNCGVSGTIAAVAGAAPYPAGLISVSLGGSKLLSSFVQPEPFYTGQNVAVLTPLAPLSFEQKVFVCLCIRHNRFRYSAFGREANRTLRTLPIPDPAEFPEWLSRKSSGQFDLQSQRPLDPGPSLPLDPSLWKPFSLGAIFSIVKGKRLTKANLKPGLTPFIAAIDSNNGLRQRVNVAPRHRGNVITVNYNGSVAEAFYQQEPFWASDDVNVLNPNFDMDEFIALFVCAIIKREKYRFNYGRKWNLDRMRQATIRLPATADGHPDWNAMRLYMQRRPFSAALITETDVRVPA